MNIGTFDNLGLERNKEREATLSIDCAPRLLMMGGERERERERERELFEEAARQIEKSFRQKVT